VLVLSFIDARFVVQRSSKDKGAKPARNNVFKHQNATIRSHLLLLWVLLA
jgi:hypothetical protein